MSVEARPVAATERDRAITLLTTLLERFDRTSEWRHTDVADIVDALISAARSPESEHTRAVADDQARVAGLLDSFEKTTRLTLADENRQ